MSTKCPESIEELEKLEALLPLCRKELLEQAQARLDAGTATSERDAARQIAEETGRKPETIRKAIQREKLGTVSPARVLKVNEFETEVLKSKVPVLVCFTAKDCAPCDRIAPAIEKIAEDYKGRIVIYKYDVDEYSEVAKQYRVCQVPQFMIFSEGKAHPMLATKEYRVREALDMFLAIGEMPTTSSWDIQQMAKELEKGKPPIEPELVIQIKSALSLIRETLLKLPIFAEWDKHGGEPIVKLDGAKRGFDRTVDQYPGEPTPEQQLLWDTYFLARKVASMADHFNPMIRYLTERLPEELPENWSTERRQVEKLRQATGTKH